MAAMYSFPVPTLAILECWKDLKDTKFSQDAKI